MPTLRDQSSFSVWLRRYITTHPSSHPTTNNDWLPFAIITLASCALIALTPPTREWRIVRASLFGLYVSYQVYFCLFAVGPSWETHWENVIGTEWFFVKGLEVMLFYPPEEHLFRIKRRNCSIKRGENTEEVEWEDEPVPEPGSLAKLYWAIDVWFSERGIGWNFAAPLPERVNHKPSTTRIMFILIRLRYLVIWYFIDDLARAYMTSSFFSSRPGFAPLYSSLSINQRTLYSLLVGIRMFWSIEGLYTLASVFFVTIGDILGWEGHWFDCEGWPPLFGSLEVLWVHPGFGQFWSKTRHQYFHHWLYLFAWQVIGETLLRLPRTGISSRPRQPPETAHQAISSSISQSEASVSFISRPPGPSCYSLPKHFLINFIKSLIVFTLTGLYHDLPSYLLLLRTSTPGTSIPLVDCFSTMTFFILQPIGICVGSVVKRFWKSWKLASRSKRGKREPRWLITLERIMGFVWTWSWLGYTSRYFILGITRSGIYLRKEGQPVKFSPLGGAIYGIEVVPLAGRCGERICD